MANKEKNQPDNQPKQSVSDEEAYRQALENIRKLPEPYQSAALSGNVEFFQDLEFPNLEKKLHEKFKLTDIEWVIVHAYDYKTQNGVAIRAYAQPYIKKESAERRADIIFGAMNWRNDYGMPDSEGRFKYKIELRKDPADLMEGEQNEWIPKIEGGSIDTSARGGFSDKAFEVALSFAEKRAWAKVGIGRYLKLVPQIEVRVSTDWEEGWNYYSFRSKVESTKQNPVYKKIYWEEPDLPEWALHEDDKGVAKKKTTANKPSPHAEPPKTKQPQKTEAQMPANEAQWDLMMAYYENMPETEKEKWHAYLFADEVDDETGEIVNTPRRKLNAAAAKKIINSLEKGYGTLNNDNVPEAFAGKNKANEIKSPEDMGAESEGSDEHEDIKQMREQANEKK